MIAVLGIPSETPVRLLLEACAAKGLSCTMLNQRRQAHWTIDYDPMQPERSCMGDGDASLALSECSGLYLRTMDHRKVPEWDTSDDRPAIERMYARLWQLLDDDSTSTTVINAPAVQLSNNSKPFQSIVICEHGLSVPDTCITSDEDTAREFFARHDAVIYKSISGTRSIVTRVDDRSLANLARIRLCPVQFQECIEGFNVRVHVVGERVFATRIRSDAVDYRYATQEGKSATLEPYVLETEVGSKCVRLAHALRLPFAGIDLMIADDGRIVCLEVNPSPGYSYYEQHTGQPISHALADLLARGWPSPVRAGGASAVSRRP